MQDSVMLWGMTATELHDRFWMSRNVQVVRRSSRAHLHSGLPYLLLNEYELAVVLQPETLVQELPDAGGTVRVTLAAPAGPGYSERVLADENDRVLGIRRSYAAPTAPAGELLLTSDEDAASQWAGDESFDRHCLAQRCPARAVVGCLLSGQVRQDQVECLNMLQQHWQHPGEQCPDVYELQPGVCIHSTTHAAAGVRFVAPVWIGAGVVLEPNDLIIGPWIAADNSSLGDDTFGDVSHANVEHSPSEAGTANRLTGKRIFDVAFSLMALAVTLPLFPLIMLLIWIEDGRPFFFAHRRQTRGGRDFTCYKFRTMCRNAESMKQALANHNACDGPQFHLRDDPRLLRIGRWLRHFHLDELPQFFNVLLGQMHVVGPRPSPDGENQFCPAWRETRLSIKPGITGLWQVQRTRAPQRDFQEWIQYDLEYIARQSWRLDLWILYRTIHRMILR